MNIVATSSVTSSCDTLAPLNTLNHETIIKARKSPYTNLLNSACL